MRVYEAIVKGLEGIGVQAAFGGAGENAAGLMLALKHSRQIRPVITRHEQAASFMACGYAMYTNRLGFCFATAGPGAFNLFSGLAVAMSDSYPVLAVSGYASMKWQGWGSLNETSGLNRTPDSRAMFAATTKKSFLLTDAADTCDVLEEAVNTAFEGRPGPVHIAVPENLTEHGVEVTDFRHVRLDVKPVVPDPARVEEIASVLADALTGRKRIVALVGFGAVRSGAGAEVKRLIERFQIPLLTTLDGKGIVSEGHPLSVGVFADSGHSSAWKAFREADVVLCIGNSLNQHATFNYREDLFENKVLIHVNISEAEFHKAYRPDHALLSDARLGVAALVEALERKVGEVPRADVDGRDYEARHITHLTGHIHPGELAQAIGRMLPPQAVLLADAGAHLAWLGYYVELEEGQHFRKAGSFGPMAGHVNGAIGLKVAHPERTVVVGCGDGCYSLSGFELMTAVENEIPVIWVIFDDREFKLIKLFQLTTYGETGLVEFQNPDFAAYAQACGADGYRVETLEEFEKAFRTALTSGRPTVIDATITRWAVPHYSPSPDGVIAGLVETLEARLRD
ncbi:MULTISPECIES: thiamine pyrophosphate-binding protein [unclassified Streptomyces]|uniref:thiamine pyrophosphate-binding protein n=1 Tax=unclassified Streptomyces TaxID=2593676 RepID=UPI00224FEB6C|nr:MULTISPECIES: thiamine pyrophosphate-binding protein [unclassified Streptomyces]MCX5149720.1 thiamine pyrophosphate-binding protein [Streptomyces sp. NBC_00320]WSN52759.1 thiamine pyrophosphate-binding protein [Streptomyces sp. NBC_01296]WSW57732.1 thiamine pyrophosphate-binding protein [Streptomyces sp. NBC_00998]